MTENSKRLNPSRQCCSLLINCKPIRWSLTASRVMGRGVVMGFSGVGEVRVGIQSGQVAFPLSHNSPFIYIEFYFLQHYFYTI